MSLPEPRWLCGSWEWVRTGQIHLPGGWSRGGLCGSGSAAAACWAPCPPASFGLTSSLRSAGLFKISSMEKDRPSFFGASQHPGLFLSIPQWRGGRALAPSAGGCVEGGGGLARAPGEASGGRRPSPSRNAWNHEGEQRWRTGILMADYPSTVKSPWVLRRVTAKTPWSHGDRSRGESWKGLYRVPTGSEPSRVRW